MASGSFTVACQLVALLTVSFAVAVAEGSTDNRVLLWLNDTADETAGCLDGSPYAFYVWPGNSSEWSVFINGGGWCMTEEECAVRAGTALGSSKGYNITGAWGPPPYNRNGAPPAFTCQGLTSNCTRVFMPYCDGSCFTSFRPGPWPVPGTNTSLHFRGRANLERTMDVLTSRFGLGNARRLMLTGGSAGGLSTILHLDYVADRVKAAAESVVVSSDSDAQQNVAIAGPAVTPPQQTTLSSSSEPTVVGRPVAGFFIDGPRYNASTPTYADDIKYMVNMFNTTSALMPKCLAMYPTEKWRCWMAPYVAPLVSKSLFLVQSRFDEFQLKYLLGVPCVAVQPYLPPYAPSNCSQAELSAIRTFGSHLVTQLQPALKKQTTGLWLVSCIQHNVVCDLNNTKEEDAFASWLAGGDLGRDIGYRWVDDCGDHGSTPCDKGPYCAPPHF